MSVSDLKPTIPEGFDSPTALPRDAAQRRAWQEANRAWWESHPMRYDFSERITAPEFSREFYAEIDERFFSDVKTFMPWRTLPFDPLLDFASLAQQDVLEIGVGNGSHAQLISGYAGSYTGIDLTAYAVRSTTKRLAYMAEIQPAPHVKVLRMDAENMAFADESFDLIWSWGVIHHSAHTRRIAEEMHRVLRPGGTAITMVYHRNFWSYHVVGGLGGIAHGNLKESLATHRSRQRLIDGAIARYYSTNEWRELVGDLFTVDDIKIYGSKAELLPLPKGRVKNVLKAITPNSLARLLTNRCRLGMFLVSHLRKQI